MGADITRITVPNFLIMRKQLRQEMLLILAVLAATLPAMSAQTDPDQVVEEFCVKILNQSADDVSTCTYKAYYFTLEDGDPAIITYLCCLGLFDDVTHNYMQYTNESFIGYISKIASQNEVPDVARFVKMCKSYAIPAVNTLRDIDYLYWLNNGKKEAVCRANSN